MRCYIIVRHKFGTKFHRNTRRNRHLVYERDCEPGEVKKGRSFRGVGWFDNPEDLLYDPQDMSFLLFAGACVETWNKDREQGQRRCTIYEIFNKESEPPEGQKYPYRYPKVSDELFEKLVRSNFPPPLLAVVTSDVIPLNLLTKGERFSSSKKTFAAKVRELKDKCSCQHCGKHLEVTTEAVKQLMLCPACGKVTRIQLGSAWFEVAREISDAHFRGDTLGKTKTVTDLKRDGEGSEQIFENVPDENVPDIYSEIDERNGWIELNEKPQAESAVQWNPKNITPGTRVQNLVFHGGWKISRRMASYWRKNSAAEYHCCCEFIRGLLKKPWPRAPSLIEMASTAPLFNALLAENFRRKRKRQVAGLSSDVQRVGSV